MIEIAGELRGVVRLGVLLVDEAKCVELDERLDAALADVEARLRHAPPSEAAVSAVRAMYRRLGLDPTKTRPSSEALLRRVLKGGPLPRVSSVVDVCNWCSVELQLPYGLYDRDRIDGAIVLRIGAPGEEYPGIRKDVVHVGGRLTLADAQGPFGNPSADSARTMVTPATTRVLVVVYGPAASGPDSVARALDVTAARLAEFCGARHEKSLVLGP